jgi:hypothetical protein
MSERQANVTQGETEGPDQEPREAGAADPAVRDPRPDGPMDQGGDAGSAEFGDYPPATEGGVGTGNQGGAGNAPGGSSGEQVEEGSPT